MMRVRVLLFDLGGVVCRFLPERRLRAPAELSGIAPIQIRAGIWESGLDRRFDAGEYSADGMYQAILSSLNVQVSRSEVEEAWGAAFEPDADLLELIAAYRVDHQTALLTDNGPLLRDALPRLFPAVTRLMSPQLFSCDLGARKPSPAIFRRAADRLDVPRDEMLLIDDSAAAVAGARAAGLQAVQFTDIATLRRDLCQ